MGGHVQDSEKTSLNSLKSVCSEGEMVVGIVGSAAGPDSGIVDTPGSNSSSSASRASRVRRCTRKDLGVSASNWLKRAADGWDLCASRRTSRACARYNF